MSNSAADTFRSLHAGPHILRLANGWDAASARLIESLGASAVATSSAAVAWAHGYADGNHLPVELLVQTVADAARAVSIPLTADIEGGYSDDPAQVEETIVRVIDAGAVGINIEDGGGSPELLAAKIEAARRAADRTGVPLFVNARTDVWLRKLASGEAAVTEALRRAALYRKAGADGLFAPGVTQASEIRNLVDDVGLLLNVLALPGLPLAADLEALGVQRLSAGTGLAHAALAALKAAAADYLEAGDSKALWARSDGSDYNALFR